MSDKEVVWSTELDTYEPCTTCLDIAMEAAYSNGFHNEDDEYQIVDEEFDGIDVPQYYVTHSVIPNEEY